MIGEEISNYPVLTVTISIAFALLVFVIAVCSFRRKKRRDIYKRDIDIEVINQKYNEFYEEISNKPKIKSFRKQNRRDSGLYEIVLTSVEEKVQQQQQLQQQRQQQQQHGNHSEPNKSGCHDSLFSNQLQKMTPKNKKQLIKQQNSCQNELKITKSQDENALRKGQVLGQKQQNSHSSGTDSFSRRSAASYLELISDDLVDNNKGNEPQMVQYMNDYYNIVARRESLTSGVYAEVGVPDFKDLLHSFGTVEEEENPLTPSNYVSVTTVTDRLYISDSDSD